MFLKDFLVVAEGDIVVWLQDTKRALTTYGSREKIIEEYGHLKVTNIKTIDNELWVDTNENGAQ